MIVVLVVRLLIALQLRLVVDLVVVVDLMLVVEQLLIQLVEQVLVPQKLLPDLVLRRGR